MNGLSLDSNDFFLLVRAIAFAELKSLRKISDVFGDEILITGQTAMTDEPMQATSEETLNMARRVAGFFCLPPGEAQTLAGLATLGNWADHVAERTGPRPEAVTFFTSGSTGEPKPVLKPFFFLEEDAKYLAGMLGGAKRMISLVPPHHIYGLIYSLLIPKVLGVCCENKRFQRPASLVKSLAPGDAVIGIPHLWKLCAATSERFPATCMGITSTSPCPPELIRTLKRQGLPVMHEIYGSSESGAMGHRSSPDVPFTLMPTWKHVGDDLFVRRHEDGSTTEPVAFQDQLQWEDETRFFVRKRLDNAVQVAGTNVFPERVREVLLAHEAVADCAVRLMRPEEGDRLKAFVVVKPGFASGMELVSELHDYLARSLTPLEQPKSITFGEALPRNEMGKLSDWSIRPDKVGTPLAQALEKLSREVVPVAPGQDFVIDAMKPDDAWGVARLFYEVYGSSFPFETYYIPERLRDENRLGLVLGVVARTGSGDVVGYGSLFRSSAPFHKVYEIGSHVILPEYRGTRAAVQLQEYIRDRLIPERGVRVCFSEAPCHQVVTQKFAAMSGLRECALEIGLMPATSYGVKDYPDDRVSMLLLFGGAEDEASDIYCPDVYDEALAFLLQGMDATRKVLPALDVPPEGHSTRTSIEHFTFAQVARMHVLTLGRDFTPALDDFEAQARQRGARVMQVFVNLGESWCSDAVEELRKRGYFLGGLMPCWFESDGLFMQRVLDLPDSKSIKLYSQRAHRILDLVLRDMESNPACKAPAPVQARPTVRAAAVRASQKIGVVLAGEGLTVDDVVAVARHAVPVTLTKDRTTLERVDASASFIEWAVRTGEPIYGVNTGYGGMANVAIAQEDLAALQNNLLRFLNVCAGDYLPLEDVRAAMLLRANSHMRGASGVRRELIERLLIFLNNGVTPLVRRMGSIGASGDLAPLASIAGALVGADECFKVVMNGETVSCLTALSRLGLAPLALGPKEGLGMVNGTSVMTAVAANCLYDARRLTALAIGFHALAVQALLGSNQSFHPFIQQLKPHPGQVNAAAIMLELLDGSRMCRNELDGHHEVIDGQPAQDRYSLRCLPQFLGPVLDGIRQATAAVEVEMNSANDNPLIDGENCLSLHSGNFLGQYVGVWMDHLRYYLGLMAKHMDTQIALMVTPEFSAGLPASLVGNTDRKVNMGLKGLQIAANSIMPLLSYHGMPIADRFPTHAEQYNQNINSQGFNSANLARTSITTLETYMAMALLFGVQAVSLRAARMGGSFDPRPMLSPPTSALYDAVLAALGRTQTPDRPLIFNDDEQSLEEMVEALRADIATDTGVARAMEAVTASLG
jgi:phenylalanine ammonia-lyase